MKNFKTYLALIPVCVLFARIYFLNQTPNYYPVQEITSFEQARGQLERCGKNSLVLFDIDDTLIIAPDYLARKSIDWWLWLRLVIAFPQFLKISNFEDVFSLMWLYAPRILIEPHVVTMINDLKNKGCTVLGLTSMESGSFGIIPSMPVWRADMLKDLGVVFTQRYPNQTYHHLNVYRYTYPVLFEGILCTNQQPKGEVLAAFLDAHKLQPEEIIFFDDGISNLQSVGHACAKRAISCTLFLYRGGEKFSSTLDMSSIIKQVDILMKEHRWLSDQEIVAL